MLRGQIEGRLLAMLEGCANLTLEQLNQTTQVWINSEYHNKVHSETRQREPQKPFPRRHGPVSTLSIV